MKFNLAIVGCGKMGLAISHFSLLSGFNNLSLYDINEEFAIKLKIKLEQQYSNLHPNIKIGLSNSKYDIVILALSGPDTQKFIQDNFNSIIFKKNKIFISLGRPNYEDLNCYFEFNEWLITHSVTLLFGLGLEPGLSEIIATYFINKHQDLAINAIKIFCGGVPQNAKPPLYYDLLFNNEIPSTMRMALCKKNNQIIKSNRFESCNNIFITESGLFEAYDDGLSPFFLNNSFCESIPNISQQTIRWPGFVSTVNTLRQCGLFDTKILPGSKISAKELTHIALKQCGALTNGNNDMTILHIEAHLYNKQVNKTTFIAKYDNQSQLTGMAKITTFPIIFAIKNILLHNRNYRVGSILSFESFTDIEIENLKQELIKYNICSIV